MPLSIRVFFALCLMLVGIWGIDQYLLFDTFPNEGYSLAARLHAMRLWLLWTAVESAIVLSLAWMSAFRRQNWARWVLAGVLILAEFIPMVSYALQGLLIGYLKLAFVQFGAKPLWYAGLAIKIAVIVLVLQARVEPWFKPTNRVV